MYSKPNLLSHDGKWSINSYTSSGVDSSDYVVTNNDLEYKKNFIRIFHSSNHFYIQLNNQVRSADYSFSLNEAKEMAVSRAAAYVSNSGTDSINPQIKFRSVLCPFGKGFIWNILKLNRREIILKSKDGSYEVSLTANK